ncbi:MAG: PHP domain-containing protein, partial [Victivallales bacterium]|nr:PHP domain-containing protein [Victivallales bacterium]
METDIIDLHSHSTYSDGTQTPEELLRQADKINLKALALTDHDTAAGIPRFLEAAAAYPHIHAIPGVEISTSLYTREIHILGLFIDCTCPELQCFLEDIQQKRRMRNELMAQKLCSLGYEIDIEEIRKHAGGKIIGRPHFAASLLENYDFANSREVFDKLLKRGAPGFVARSLPQPDQAIAVIHQAGGIAIWAHPIYRKSRERAWGRKILKQLVPVGLDAIEAYYTQFNHRQTMVVKDLAMEFDIALAGGSDYHGSHHPGIALGHGYGELRVPEA